MDRYSYLIVGGGIAGTTAAEVIRSRDASGAIAIISDEPHRLYSRIMLSKPNFFLEKIPFDHIWLKSEEWYQKSKIELLAGRKATALDPAAHTLHCSDNTSIAYEQLLLATGVAPNHLDVPGSGLPGVYYLRTMDDCKAIIAAMKSARTAVVVGGGFIGFEMCDMLRLGNHGVTLVIREPHYWDPILDKPSGRMIEQALESGGVGILRNVLVQKILGDARAEGIALSDGTRLACDMVIIGVGAHADVAWLKQSGLAVNRGIVTNEFMQTNVPGIWAAGDAAEFHDVVLSEQIQLGNWVNAQSHGRVAGANMSGSHQPFRLVSFYTTQGMGITIGFIGDVSPGAGKTVIPRGSAEINSYARLIVKDGELIGATLINRTQELGVLGRIIEKDVKVDAMSSQLADSNFDLKTII